MAPRDTQTGQSVCVTESRVPTTCHQPSSDECKTRISNAEALSGVPSWPPPVDTKPPQDVQLVTEAGAEDDA